MAAFLSISVRPEHGAADGEYASFRRGLGVDRLDRWDLLATPLDTAALTSYDGIVIGGSPFNATTTEKSSLQQRVEADLEAIAAAALDGGAATLFTCYSIGVLTRMLGGEVDRDHPEEASSATIRLTAAGTADPIFGDGSSTLAVLTAHTEGSATPPPGALLLAEGDACPVQAYRVGDRLYATQFHPEPTPDDFAERMTFYRGKGYFDSENFAEAQSVVRASAPNDGIALLHRFAEVFGR